MRLPFTLILALFAHGSVFAAKPAKRHYATHDYYVLEHNPLADASLDECARALGVEVVEQAGELQHHWLVRTVKPDLSARDSGDRVLRTLEAIQAQARSSVFSRADDVVRSRRVASSVKYLDRQVPRQRVKRAPPPIGSGHSSNAPTSEQIAQRLTITDPEFPRQWHLANDDFPRHMMNVSSLWEMGITGKGVISALVDDGLDYNSDDLAPNFDASGSYDFNDHVELPTPMLFDDHHGTRCAGQIAAAKNDVCGVGIAYDSKVAGIRILSGPISDIDEASALNYGYQNTSIYSCSWGPPDDGRAMEGPSYLIKKSIVTGIQKGREGKGSVFVFAAGNGGRNGDQCNFDGYTNSIFSVTVAAIDFRGLHPDYSEPCAANMVSAYSSGGGEHITTTDVGKNKCSHTHGGTSAAAPNAAGVLALALSVRPELTWRDVQHLCVHTALKINPEDPDWEDTATGRPYSYKYGYGSLDGYALVTAARDWKLVKPQGWVNIPPVQIAGGTMDIFQAASGGELIVPGGVKSSTTITQAMLADNNFEKLEHITVTVWITHTRRGDVEVELVSPKGVKSILAGKRYQDSSSHGFPGWTFMTVKHWDEDPVGQWTIRVSDQNKENEVGHFLGWSMTLWGSVVDPSNLKVFDVPVLEGIFPPVDTGNHDSPTSTTAPQSTPGKTITKPTAHLPGDHGSAPGEASKPAFPGGQPTAPAEDVSVPSASASSAASATSTPTPDEGWFSDLSNLVSNQMWLFIAVGAVVLFGVATGIFFWRRAVARRKNYSSLPAGDDVAMSSVGGGRPRTKELYDAFGEVSDDEDADEETGLRPSRPHGTSPGGLGFHSGFLDDDDPASAGGPAQATRYRDEPEVERERPQSPAGSGGSGDGSWEHASDPQ